MLKIDMEAVPNINENEVIDVNYQGNKVLMRTVRHPEMGIIEFNGTATKIYNMCNGKNDVNNIIESIFMETKGVTRDTVIEDICMILYSMAEMRLISWDRDAFKQEYRIKISNNFEGIIIRDFEIDEFMKNLNSCKANIVFFDKYYFNVNRIMKEIAYRICMIAQLKNQDNKRLTIDIRKESKKSKSLFLNIISNEGINFYEDKNEILKFIRWNVSKFNFMNNTTQYDKVIVRAIKNKDSLEKELVNVLNFKKIGCETKSIYNDNNVEDIEYWEYNLSRIG